MSALRLASRLIDEAAIAGSRHAAILVRVFVWLALPAVVLASATLAIDPGHFITGGVDVEALTINDLSTIALVAGRAFSLYAPLWLMVSVCSLALEGAVALAGWQLLHGRSATTRALLLGLYARRWAVIGLVFTKTLIIGAAQLAFLLPALGALFLAVLPGFEGVGVMMEGIPQSVVFALLIGAPMLIGSFLFSIAMPAVMVEEAGPVAALRRSVQLLRRQGAISVWAWSLAVVLAGVLVFNLEGLLAAFGLVEESQGLGVLAAIQSPRAYVASLIAGMVGVPVKALILVALYRWLRIETEGWGEGPGWGDGHALAQAALRGGAR